MAKKVSRVVKIAESVEIGDDSVISIEENLKPLIITMKMFGLFYPQGKGSVNDPSHLGKPTGKFTILIRTLCILLLLMSTFSVLRFIPAFWTGFDFKSNLTTDRIVTFGWIMQCFTNKLFTLRATAFRGRLHLFFDIYNEFQINMASCNLNLKPQCKKVRQIIKIVCFVSWGFAIMNMTFIATFAFSDIIPGYHITLENPFSSQASRYIFTIVYLLEVAAWIFPVTFNVALLSFLRLQFANFKNALEKRLKDDHQCVLVNISAIRKKHLQICKMVSVLEQDMQYAIASTVTTASFLSCFLVYHLVRGDLSFLAILLQVMWLVINVILLLSVTIAAAIVHEEAHSPLDVLYDLDLPKATTDQVNELMMFLSKLNGPAVGFTALGLVVITKEFILTLAGVFFTYFFLLLQFNIN